MILLYSKAYDYMASYLDIWENYILYDISVSRLDC